MKKLFILPALLQTVHAVDDRTKKLFAVFCGFAALGFSAWFYQLYRGLVVTGMNEPVFWGLYIVTFVFLVGISAGGIAIASLSHLAGIEQFKPVSRIAEITAIVCLIMAMTAITFDLGRPDRIYNLLLHARLNSPLIWDVGIINIYFLLCCSMLAASLLGKEKLLKRLSYVSLPAFVLVHSITAWIFGLMKSRAGWHTSILAPLFISSALVSGLALVILVALFVRKAFRAEFGDDMIVKLGAYFKILLPVLFYLLFCEFLTVLFPAMPKELAVTNELLSGRFAGIFWFDMVAGIAVPFAIIMSRYGRTAAGVGIASALALAGVFAERINLILPSLFHPLLHNDKLSYVYHPTGVELLAITGLFAFGASLLTAAAAVIPLVPERKK